MQSKRHLLAAACLALLTTGAQAGVVKLTFEGAVGELNNYYAGGVDSDGHTGPALGISFDHGIAVVDNTGGNSYGPPLANGPSPHTVLETRYNQLVINHATGFKKGFSLFFASAETVRGTAKVYKGPNGTGKLLASFDLAGIAQCPNETAYYCHWQAVGASFTGTAKSVVLSNPDVLHMFYDNLTFGSATPRSGAAAPVASK